MPMHRWVIVALLLFAAVVASEDRAWASNVLVIVADDVGVDMLNAYWAPGDLNRPIDVPPTPNISSLAADGVTFKNAWGNPLCSPTRATIQTGRYGFRTGVTRLSNGASNELPLCETTLPEALGRLEVAPMPASDRAAIGKWHLGNVFNGESLSPNLAGYGYYAGSLPCCLTPDYYHWSKTVNGVTNPVRTVYATTDAVDEAIGWIGGRTGPWFLWLAFNAPHFPHYAPPPALHTRSLPANLLSDGRCKTGNRPCYLAALEALDKEIGRLLAWMPAPVRAQTTIIFLGDNGTPPEVLPPGSRSKFTLYQGGIRVPLIISGAQVVPKGQKRDGLVNTTDLFVTAIELIAGTQSQAALDELVNGRKLDSISLKPVLDGTQAATARTFTYSELNQARTIRDARYKLLRQQNGIEEFYDLLVDPDEIQNRISDSNLQTQIVALRGQMDTLTTLATDDDCDNDDEYQDMDNCRELPNNGQANFDDDIAGDVCDNCWQDSQAFDEFIDTDGDGQGDVCDPNDDNDETADAADNCPLFASTNQADGDGDLVGDACDDCPAIADELQLNTDADAQGDVCDPDDDNDGDLDAADNCPVDPNPDQADLDGDAVGNACDFDDDNDLIPDGGDICPLHAASQTDSDLDLVGDLCDNCVSVANATQLNSDSDGRGDACDNCPTVSNPNQLDSDHDGKGNACDRDLVQTCDSYCAGEGLICVQTYSGPGGCCGFECHEDASCVLPDPEPVNACL